MQLLQIFFLSQILGCPHGAYSDGKQSGAVPRQEVDVFSDLGATSDLFLVSVNRHDALKYSTKNSLNEAVPRQKMGAFSGPQLLGFFQVRFWVSRIGKNF